MPTFPHSCVSTGTPGCPAGRDPRSGSLPRDVWSRAALPGHRGDIWHPLSLLPSKTTPFPGSVARGTSGPSCHPGNSLVSTLSREYEQPAAPGADTPPGANPGQGLFAPLVPSLGRTHSWTRNYLRASLLPSLFQQEQQGQDPLSFGYFVAILSKPRWLLWPPPRT